MKGFIVFIVFAAFLWPSCHSQIEGDVILLLKNTIDLLHAQNAKISSLEEQISDVSNELKGQGMKLATLEVQNRMLSDVVAEQEVKLQSGFNEMTETLLISSAIEHNELLNTFQTFTDNLNKVVKSELCHAFEMSTDDPIKATKSELLHTLQTFTDNPVKADKSDLLHTLQTFTENPVKAAKSDLLQTLQTFTDNPKKTDKNECLDGSNECSEFAHCIDSALSYDCQCFNGYSGDGFRCYDIDECMESTDACHQEAECNNTGGNYTCACKKPYEGDGYSCEHPCGDHPDALVIKSVGCLKFIPTKMEWEDSRSYCSTLNMRLAENIPREHYSTLWNEFKQYNPLKWASLRMWVGGKRQRWESNNATITKELYSQNEPDGLMDSCIYLHLNGENDDGEGLRDFPCNHARYPLCQVIL